MAPRRVVAVRRFRTRQARARTSTTLQWSVASWRPPAMRCPEDTPARARPGRTAAIAASPCAGHSAPVRRRSEEHTSETPVTNAHLVCRLLLEKKKKKTQLTNKYYIQILKIKS